MICVEIDIKAELVRLAEPEYAVFSRRLLPGTENVLGVRLPLLRRLARRIAKGDWAAYLDTAGDGSFEEVMLQGMVIGAICAPPQEVLARTAAFVPKIDNWSVCDSFCSGLKLARTHPEPVWEFLQPYFEDPRPFAVRFAVVMLLFYYIDAQHLPRVLALLEEVHSDEYYVKMAVAWAASMCYAAFPDETLTAGPSGKFVNLIRSMQSRNPICAHWSGVGRVDAPLSSAKNGRGEKAAPVFCFSPYAPCSAAAHGAPIRWMRSMRNEDSVTVMNENTMRPAGMYVSDSASTMASVIK